jgi:cytidylate kinase
MAVITISRQPGALGEEIAARLAGKMGFLLVDRQCLARLWREMNLDEAGLKTVNESVPPEKREIDAETDEFPKLLPELIAHLAEEHDLVVIGSGAQGLFRSRSGTLHVRVVAPRGVRVGRVQTGERLCAREARRHIRTLEMRRARHLRLLYHLSWHESSLYDLTLQTDRLSIDQAVNLVIAAADQTQIRQVPRSRIVEGLLPETTQRRGNGRFANSTEEEFACCLEFYGIPYEYEPRTFPLETDAEGRIAEAFTPDFYLPQQDLYIELTTMKQSLVTRKNRKVKKLRRLYPEINIRIFYQRDFYRLMAKYGLLTDDAARTKTGINGVNMFPAVCRPQSDKENRGTG